MQDFARAPRSSLTSKTTSCGGGIAKLEEQRDAHMAGKVRLKTILDQAGQHLVSGIQRYNEEMREAIGVVTEEPRLIERAAE